MKLIENDAVYDSFCRKAARVKDSGGGVGVAAVIAAGSGIPT